MPHDTDDGMDNEAMMDHCALECMRAIENKDREGFRDAFHVLIADILDKMSSDEPKDEE